MWKIYKNIDHLEKYQFYSWKNISHEEKCGIFLEENDDFLQFAIFDTEEQIWNSYMILAKKFFKNFQKISWKIPENPTLQPKFSLIKNSLKKICKNRLPCEFTAKIDGIVDDFWDIIFEENEFRFYPIEKDGTYLNDGYLPFWKEKIASIHYNSWYMNYLRQKKEK